MREQRKTTGQKITSKEQPYRVRLPGFLVEEETGLGDIIKRITYAGGIAPCAGCERRAARMNRWLTFYPR
jgi:hypothetical protein